MSQNGNTQNSLAIQKKNLLNQKIGQTYYPNLEFAHESSGGETIIDFNALVAPNEAVTLEGFSNPQPSQLIAAAITQNRGNVKLHSSARGELQRFTEFYIREDNKIRLLYETEENEIITGMINNAVRTVPQLLDVKKISFTGALAEGATDVVIGAEYNINANPSTQLGDLVVYRWQGEETPKLMVRCEGNDILNDGNYIEKLNAIEFKEGGRVGGENIAIFSPNCIPVEFQNSFKTDLETLGGQVDLIAEFLQDVHALPTNPFQGAPNQIDLRSFGQKVIDTFGVIFGAVVIPASYLTKLAAVFGKTKSQTKILGSDYSGGDTQLLAFNNLETGKRYRITIQAALGYAASSSSGYVQAVHNGGVICDVRNDSSSSTTSGGKTAGSSNVFTATTALLEIRGSASGGQPIRGNNSLTETWAMLEELPNHEETTQWT